MTTTWLVNVNEEYKNFTKGGINADFGTSVWSPLQEGSGYDKIWGMNVGDNIIQYYYFNKVRHFIEGTVVSVADYHSRPENAETRHNTDGFFVNVSIVNRFTVGPNDNAFENLLGLANAPDTMNYNEDFPFAVGISTSGNFFPTITLKGYIWKLNEEFMTTLHDQSPVLV